MASEKAAEKAAPQRVDAFTFRAVIALHALAMLLFAGGTFAGHHWSAEVISENRLADVKTKLAGV